jgi:hypothetical protein
MCGYQLFYENVPSVNNTTEKGVNEIILVLSVLLDRSR